MYISIAIPIVCSLYTLLYCTFPMDCSSWDHPATQLCSRAMETGGSPRFGTENSCQQPLICRMWEEGKRKLLDFMKSHRVCWTTVHQAVKPNLDQIWANSMQTSAVFIIRG